MTELNLTQITDKLNSEFAGGVRKLVFWYDANAEFVDDVDAMELVNAEVLHLEPDNQFYIKYFLECEDTATNYLVYAPFAKPDIRENHLADTIKYSKEFFADRASLLTIDLGIDERYKPVIQHHIRFFGEKKRTQAFYDLELETFNKNTIEIAMMSVLCKCRIPSYEEVLRTVLMAGFGGEKGVLEQGNDNQDVNPYLAEFFKFDLLDAFWRQAQDMFGYADEKPTLEKLTMTLFVTYAAKEINADLPVAWGNFISFKSGNVIAFIDNLMNSYIYGERFDEISAMVYDSLRAGTELRKLPVESLVSCGIFAGIDELIIDWIIARLEMEDVAAKLGDITIPQLVKQRRQGHFGRQYRSEYFVLQNAWNIIAGARYSPAADLNELVKKYTSELYKMDRYYRYFYYYLDKVNPDIVKTERSEKFDKLKELIENIYANEYLAKICTNWNDLFGAGADTLQTAKQTEFFNRNVNYVKEQVIVIISDALRYEVGMTLLGRLQADEKCTATIKPMISTLPSITPYGMAALLPHKTLELTDDYSVLVDGRRTDTLEQRQAILQSYRPEAFCITYDDIKNMNISDLKILFARKPVTYIYHNQIDARGENLHTENEVFNACEEAVEEIYALIKRLTSANKKTFIVTSDHGFIYRRNCLSESDKVGLKEKIEALNGYTLGRRYLVAEEAVSIEGTAAAAVGTMMMNDDNHMVSYPVGADVFKAKDPGLNYVHGGSSPQEMLIPMIEVKTERGYKETTTAQISLLSLTSRITNLITSLDFVQTEPVSDVVKETIYRIYFVDDTGEKISNEHLYMADKKDVDTVKRVFRLRFSFKNRKYDKNREYYLVAYDDNSSLEVLRHRVVMDIAFADDFGF